ncbi:sugar transporter [Gluconacetobacter sacchari DSM 12717]|uniref:MFS transporter n=2 Tax=Gluconacetobacter sacchari TaxID=92759 RepID=A0A7W4NJB2_9PROT|nr:MFS transporter [Gluconacetobacter sacchari]MBB2158819.1 MFS transporter [Gluconacetobacter sacchari]GBQ21129.1 sugar transporter [Gluconacetobacter sacchari DSM 12717]
MTPTPPPGTAPPSRSLSDARHIIAACFLGWTLDACDFFIVLFTLDNVARSFSTSLEAILLAPTLTLISRPIGAYLFGRAADRHGRRPVLMATIVTYSLIELLSAFAPNLTVFLALRLLFGVALGGEWGVGTSLTMETVPPHWRGMASGLLQAGYPAGYLLASLMFLLLPALGWQGLFILGASTGLSVVYVALYVKESPVWLARRQGAGAVPDAARRPMLATLRRYRGPAVYAVCLMAAFNFFSHGSQDLFPKIFLALQRHLPHPAITAIVVAYTIAAIAGGLCFGALSERIGRARTIALAATLALPLLPLWALSTTPLWIGVGAVLIQFCIQGAWGVVPAYLNELSPPDIRATFPGVAYQCGNLIAASTGLIQNRIALGMGGDLAPALMIVVGCAGGAIALLATLAGPRFHAHLAGAPD